MDSQIVVAIVGAIATVTAALVSVLPTLLPKLRTRQRAGGSKSIRRETLIIAGSILVGALLVVWSIRAASDPSVAAENLDELIESGRSTGSAYVLPAVTVLVNFERVMAPAPHLEARWRILYNLYSLKSIGSNDRLFEEEYHSTSSADIVYMPGTDRERLTESAVEAFKKWNVFFDLPAARWRTPLSPTRSGCSP